MSIFDLTPEQLADAAKLAKEANDRDKLLRVLNWAKNPMRTFEPRPDNLAEFDEQTSFIMDDFYGMACLLGGNRSGKSDAGSIKTARFLLTHPPPRPYTPFWVLSQTYDMASGVCWGEKLSKWITPDMIEDIHWYKMSSGQPQTVILKKHANGNNWMIEFKSSEADRRRLQAAQVAGCWLDELCPMSIITEVMTRCVDLKQAGNLFYTLTPLDSSPELEDRFNNQEKFPNWRFYRLNTHCNKTLPVGAIDEVVADELEERRDTRLRGSFTTTAGAVFKGYNPKLHVIKPFTIPQGWWKVRAIDPGFDHPFCCLWLARDLEGAWYVYHEYYQNKTSIEEHVEAINAVDWQATEPDYGCTYADFAAGQVIYEMALRGLDTVPARKAAGDVKASIIAVQTALRTRPSGKAGLYIFDNCKRLIWEMKKYRWHPNIADKPLKEFDDAIDCLRYAIFSDKMEPKREPFRPLEKRKRDWTPKVVTN